MSRLNPDIIVDSPTRITAQMLEKMNVKALLLDLDGTLAASGVSELAPETLAWAHDLARGGIKLFVLSNNKSGERVRVFAGRLGAPWAHLSRKPRTRGYFAAARALGLEISETAMVGDQIFTDTLGANRAGAKSILVETLDRRWYQRLRRLAETPFRKEKKA